MIIDPYRFAVAIPTTWSPTDTQPSIILSSGNLVATHGSTDGLWRSGRATKSIPATAAGYFEIVLLAANAAPEVTLGIATSTASLTNFVGSDSAGWSVYLKTGQKATAGGLATYGVALAVNDVLGVAFKNGSVWFSKNGVWMNSGDPVAGTGAAFAGITGNIFPMQATFNNTPDSVRGRFALASFTGTPPTGFPAWDAA